MVKKSPEHISAIRIINRNIIWLKFTYFCGCVYTHIGNLATFN